MTIFAILAAMIAVAIAAAVAVRAIGGNIALVSDWKIAWRYYSTWGMMLVAFLPDLWNAVIAGGFISTDDVSSEFSWTVKAVMLAVFLVKQIKQAPRPKLPEFITKLFTTL